MRFSTHVRQIEAQLFVWSVVALLIAGCASKPAAEVRPADRESKSGIVSSPFTGMDFPTPELVKLWESALHDANVRSAKSPDPARQRSDDIYLAGFVLASSDSELMDWVTTSQVVTAARVLIAHDSLGDQECLYLLRHLARHKTKAEAVRKIIVEHGTLFVPRIVAERSRLGDEYGTELMRDIGKANNAALVGLLAISMNANETTETQAWAIELLDRATRGGDAPPPPSGTADVWRVLAQDSRTEIAQAATRAGLRKRAGELAPIASRDAAKASAAQTPAPDAHQAPAKAAGDAAPAKFPSPREIAAWSKSLEEARIRALIWTEANGRTPPSEMIIAKRPEDIGLAGWVLGSFAGQEKPWVTVPQLVIAAQVLIVHSALIDHQRPVLVNALKYGPAEDVKALREIVIRQGAAMTSTVVDAHDGRSKDFTIKLMWELGDRDPASLDKLLAISRDSMQSPARVESSVVLLDAVTSGKTPLPLPPGTLDVWLRLVEEGRSPVPAAATDALLRHPEVGFREDDRVALNMLSFVKSQHAIDVAAAGEFIPRLMPGRARDLVLRALIVNLSSDRMGIREETAKLLSQWPQPSPEASEAVAKLVISEPLRVTPDGKVGMDPRVIQSCVNWLIRGGPQSAAAAPVLAAATSDPERGESAQRILDAIGPDAVPLLLTAYTEATNAGNSEQERLRYVRLISQRSMAGPAAEVALLLILGNPVTVDSIRLEAILGLAHASHDLPAVRKALIAELRSDKVPLRLAAAAALAAIKPGDDTDLSFAVEWIKTGDGPHRVAGARLLAAAGPRTAAAAIPPLLRMSDNICSIQRGTAATALAAINPDGSKLSAAVVASVYHHDPVMRSHLLAAAKNAGDPKLIERLKDLAANEPDPQVREAAKQTLALIAK